MPPAFIDTALATGRPDTLAALRALLEQTQVEGRAWHPSPEDWRDEVLYFLLPDRFSDNRESTRPLLTRAEIRRLRQVSTSRPDIQWNQWADSGKRWQGGTIDGIRGRLDYLRGLGVSAIWVGPIFKQRARVDSYHGYGIQDFLDVDPRFGTRADLVALVRDAHARGMRIILDVIVNHSGDNWGYVPPAAPAVGRDQRAAVSPLSRLLRQPVQSRYFRLASRVARRTSAGRLVRRRIAHRQRPARRGVSARVPRSGVVRARRHGRAG